MQTFIAFIDIDSDQRNPRKSLLNFLNDEWQGGTIEVLGDKEPFLRITEFQRYQVQISDIITRLKVLDDWEDGLIEIKTIEDHSVH